MVGRYPTNDLALGFEAAGVMADIGAQVSSLAVGDAVFGLAKAALGTSMTTDERLLAPLPPAWTFTRGAAFPVAFLTHGWLCGKSLSYVEEKPY